MINLRPLTHESRYMYFWKWGLLSFVLAYCPQVNGIFRYPKRWHMSQHTCCLVDPIDFHCFTLFVWMGKKWFEYATCMCGHESFSKQKILSIFKNIQICVDKAKDYCSSLPRGSPGATIAKPCSSPLNK